MKKGKKQRQQEGEAKQLLVLMLQKKLQKGLTKGAIEYTTQEYPGTGFQTTVAIPADGGACFVGEVAPDKKAAEANAAKIACQTYGPQVGDVAIKKKGDKKAEPPKKEMKFTGDKATAKGDLCAVLQKKLKKNLEKGAIEYQAAEVKSGFQVTVVLACCDGAKHIGQPDKDKKTAEANAALVALKKYAKEIGATVGGGGAPAAPAAAAPTSMKKQKTPPAAAAEPPAKKAKKANGTAPPAKAAPAKAAPAAPAQSAFSQLNDLIPKITKGQAGIQVQTADVTAATGPAKQCTITIPSLPGYETTEITGEPAAGPKDAKENAAKEALKLIAGDANLQAKIAATLAEKKAKDAAKKKK
jgi:hypothetical protein